MAKARRAVQFWDELKHLTEFRVTDEHLALLKRGNVSWHYLDEGTGVVGLDVKRPFGNSDIWESIAEIVDGPFLEAMGDGAREDFIEANDERWERLYAEVGLALQISLYTGQFSTGLYHRDPLFARWSKAD